MVSFMRIFADASGDSHFGESWRYRAVAADRLGDRQSPSDPS
jgi:hypothetical protein